MSEMERHIGKIKKVDLNGLTIEEWCKKRCEEFGFKKEFYYNSYRDVLFDKDIPTVVDKNKNVWEIIEDKEEEDTEDISILTPNNDGTYSYIMQFYNGGTCLSEMLEDCIKNIKEN